jgi:putative glutamine amidotransferase
MRITPSNPRPIDGLDGLIIGGGADVDPELYGHTHTEVIPKAKPLDETWGEYLIELLLMPFTWAVRALAGWCVSPGRDPQRDRLEMQLIDQAIQRHLPVLGICRGQQLLNVYFGGTLHRELKGFYVEEPEVQSILPRKRIVVEEDSRLFRALGKKPRRVNALHRQGVDRLGERLKVSARDRNGIVQAIETEGDGFVVGVQWHPEYLPQLSEQRGIFRELVREARNGKIE